MSKMALSIARKRLMKAIENTYDDARFLIGRRMDDAGDFFTGLCQNKSEFCTKAVLLNLVKSCLLDAIPSMPEFPDNLVLSANVYVWKPLINQNQVFNSEPVAGYHHVTDRGCPHHDIHFRIDHEKRTITFRLGDKTRTVSLVEHSGFCWKPGRAQIFCMEAAHLEESLLDPFWSQIAPEIGRRILRIKPAI